MSEMTFAEEIRDIGDSLDRDMENVRRGTGDINTMKQQIENVRSALSVLISTLAYHYEEQVHKPDDPPTPNELRIASLEGTLRGVAHEIEHILNECTTTKDIARIQRLAWNLKATIGAGLHECAVHPGQSSEVCPCRDYDVP